MSKKKDKEKNPTARVANRIERAKKHFGKFAASPVSDTKRRVALKKLKRAQRLGAKIAASAKRIAEAAAKKAKK